MKEKIESWRNHDSNYRMVDKKKKRIRDAFS